MKRTFLLLAVTTSVLNAQTLTQSTHEPLIGDIEHIRQLDTAAFSTGLPLNVTGANSVWDFSKAIPATAATLINTYDAPATYTHNTLFPGATIVQNLIGSMHTYYKSSSNPTPQAEIVGIYSPTISLTFTNSAIAIQYPANLGLNINDPVSGTFTASSVNGTFNGNSQTTADGTGTLIVQGGTTFTNVIRVKNAQTLTLTTSNPLLGGTLRQTVYNYYDATKKFPIVNISYIKFSLSISPTPTVIAGMFGTVDSFTPLGVSEATLPDELVNLSPNPADNLLRVEIKDPTLGGQVGLFNLAGDKVLTAEQPAFTNQQDIDVSSLSAGLYLFRLETPKGTLTRKLVIAR